MSTSEGSEGRASRRAIHTLHRYYIWQNRMRVEFENVLTDAAERGVPVTSGSDEEIHAFMWMSYWYAGLYVVVEGWRELDLRDPEVDQLLASANVEPLRRYRNGVFHFQRQYFDERFVGLLADGENVVNWVRSLNQALGRVFLERLDDLSGRGNV